MYRIKSLLAVVAMAVAASAGAQTLKMEPQVVGVTAYEASTAVNLVVVKPEIKLDDLTKVLYFFYLHHPEGVAFKELQDHQEELLRIYQSISPRTDDAAMRRSIESLASPYSPSRDSSASRIRRAFRTVLGPHVSKNYYIDGPSGAPRTIALPRDLVIWE